ncbi:MAG: hypothetical protein ABI725_03295 [Chloroflexota bacterium]
MDQQQTPAQPQWSPPPQQPTGWGGPGGMGPMVRPTGVTLAAIYLIVMGVLIGLVGGCAAAVGGVIGSGDSQVPGLGGLGAVVGGIGIIIAVIGIVAVVAGAGALGGKSWGRWIGILISVIFAILLILGGITSLSIQNGMTGAVLNLVLGVLFALTAWTLIKASAFFAARR